MDGRGNAHGRFYSFLALTVSGPGYLDSALLVVRFLRNRASCIQSQFIDQTPGIKERNEDQAARWLVTATRFDTKRNFTTTGSHFDLHAALQLTCLRIVRVHEHNRIRKCLIKLRHPTRHCPRVPVFEHPTGGHPEIKLFIRNLGSRLVRQRENDRFAVLMAVKLDALAFLDIRVVALTETP